MNRIVPIAEPKQIPQRSSDFIDTLMDEYVSDRVFTPARPCLLATGERHQCSLLDHLEEHLEPVSAPSVLMHIR